MLLRAIHRPFLSASLVSTHNGKQIMSCEMRLACPWKERHPDETFSHDDWHLLHFEHHGVLHFGILRCAPTYWF